MSKHILQQKHLKIQDT